MLPEMSVTRAPFPAEFMADMDSAEAELVAEVSARSDTMSLIVKQAGAMIGYAIFGFDATEMVTIYAAKSKDSILAKAAMIGLFGAAQVVGKPLRVHTQKIRAMAKTMGAERAFACVDGDGLPMGVFDGQQV